jgi:hypothetical protein
MNYIYGLFDLLFEGQKPKAGFLQLLSLSHKGTQAKSTIMSVCVYVFAK